MKFFMAAIAIPFLSALALVGCAPRDVATRTNPLNPSPRQGKVLVGPIVGRFL
jgi:hypothetical protein